MYYSYSMVSEPRTIPSLQGAVINGHDENNEMREVCTR